jgi:hypothetical protein
MIELVIVVSIISKAYHQDDGRYFWRSKSYAGLVGTHRSAGLIAGPADPLKYGTSLRKRLDFFSIKKNNIAVVMFIMILDCYAPSFCFLKNQANGTYL